MLHTDGSLLPRSRGRARLLELAAGGLAHTTEPRGCCHLPYESPAGSREPVDYCVTLNGNGRISAASEIGRMVYDHPVYTLDTIDAQRAPADAVSRADGLLRRLPRVGISRGRMRVGDPRGARAGVPAVSGAALYRGPSCTPGRGPVRHRSAPPSTCGWSTSTTSPPCRAGRARWAAPERPTTWATPVAASARTSTPSWPCAASTWEAAGCGCGQRPCAGLRLQPADGLLVRRCGRRLRCVVAEVHNTYGERHCYVLEPGADGRAGRRRRSTCRPSSLSTAATRCASATRPSGWRRRLELTQEASACSPPP